MPFTIFARPRPIRTAFLVNSAIPRPENAHVDAILDGVVSFCNFTWGGHFNPLVVVGPEGSITTERWEELVEADVDEIYVSSTISEELLKKLDSFIPWNIREAEHISRYASDRPIETDEAW